MVVVSQSGAIVPIICGLIKSSRCWLILHQHNVHSLINDNLYQACRKHFNWPVGEQEMGKYSHYADYHDNPDKLF